MTESIQHCRFSDAQTRRSREDAIERQYTSDGISGMCLQHDGTQSIHCACCIIALAYLYSMLPLSGARKHLRGIACFVSTLDRRHTAADSWEKSGVFTNKSTPLLFDMRPRSDFNSRFNFRKTIVLTLSWFNAYSNEGRTSRQLAAEDLGLNMQFNWTHAQSDTPLNAEWVANFSTGRET